MGTGDFNGAILSYETALTLAPETGSAYANLGALYYQTGDFEKSYERFKKAILLGENTPNTRNNYAVVLARKGKFKEAVAEIEKVLTLHPDDNTALSNLERFRKVLGSRTQ